MNHRDAGAAEPARNPQAEARGVDRDHDVGLQFAGGGSRLTEAFGEKREVRQHLGQPHEGQLLHGEQAFQALRFALRPADAGKPHAAFRLLFQRVHQPTGEVIA
jgi:hypothetical protein